MTEQQRKPVVFIAGPMTGYHNYNRDEFNAEARMLEDRGFTVLNPAILPDGLPHSQYLFITLAMLESADAIFMLDGWEKSGGAFRGEHDCWLTIDALTLNLGVTGHGDND